MSSVHTSLRCISPDNCPGIETDFVTDYASGDCICTLCGVVQEERMISQSPDWNSYPTDGGKIQNKSRCGWTDPCNPFDTHCTFIPKGCKTTVYLKDGSKRIYDLAKWQSRLVYSSKQKSFSIVAKEFQTMLEKSRIPKIILNLCKKLWGEVMKNGKINRGGNRKGMIACCLLYACCYNEVPRYREEIAKIMNIELGEITKGEPLFRDALENSQYSFILKHSLDTESMFPRFLGKLKLDYKFVSECHKVKQDCEEELSFVAPKSAVAAIICYVLRNIHKLKKPTKKEITTVTGVCNPTMNKTVKYIIAHYEK